MVDSFSLINDGNSKNSKNLTIVKHKMNIDNCETNKSIEIASEHSKVEEASSSSPLLSSLLLSGKSTTNGQKKYDVKTQQQHHYQHHSASNTIMGARGAATIGNNNNQENSDIIVVPTSPVKFHQLQQQKQQSLLQQNHEEALMTKQQTTLNLRSPEKSNNNNSNNYGSNSNEANLTQQQQHTSNNSKATTTTTASAETTSSKNSDNNLIKDNLIINNLNNNNININNKKLLNDYDALISSDKCKINLSAQQPTTINNHNNNSNNKPVPSTSSASVVISAAASSSQQSKSILENCLLQPTTVKNTLVRNNPHSPLESQLGYNKMDDSTLTQTSELPENRKVEPLKINLKRPPITTVIKVPQPLPSNAVDSPPKITIKPIKPPENETIPKITIRPVVNTTSSVTVSPTLSTSSSSSLSSGSSMENLAEPIVTPNSPQKTIQVVPKLHIKNLSESSGNCEASEPYCVPKLSLRSVPTTGTMPNLKHSSVIVNNVNSESNDCNNSGDSIPKITIKMDKLDNHVGSSSSSSSSGNGTGNHHHHHHHHFNSNNDITVPKVVIKNQHGHHSTQSILSKEGVKLTIKSIPEQPPPPLIPKLTIKTDSENMFITSSTTPSSDDPSPIPKLTIKSTAKSMSAEQVPSPTMTIPKVTIKPIVRPDDEGSGNVGTTTDIVPKLNIKTIPKPDDSSNEQHQEAIPKLTIKTINNNSNSDNSSSFEKVVPKLVVKLPKDQPSYDGIETGTDCSSSPSPSPSPPIISKLNIKPLPPPPTEATITTTTPSSESAVTSTEKEKEKEPVPKIHIKLPTNDTQSSDTSNHHHHRDSPKLSPKDTTDSAPSASIPKLSLSRKATSTTIIQENPNPPNDLHKLPLEINTSTSNKTTDSGQDSPRIILKINKTSKETISSITSEIIPPAQQLQKEKEQQQLQSTNVNSNSIPNSKASPPPASTSSSATPAESTLSSSLSSKTITSSSSKATSSLLPNALTSSKSNSSSNSNEKIKTNDAIHAQNSSINNSNLMNNFNSNSSSSSSNNSNNSNSVSVGTKRAHTRSSALEMAEDEIPKKVKITEKKIVEEPEIIVINDDSSNSMDAVMPPVVETMPVKSVVKEPAPKEIPVTKLEENQKNLSRILTRIQRQRKEEVEKEEVTVQNCEKMQNILLLNDGEGSSNDCIMIQEDPLRIEKNESSQDSQEDVLVTKRTRGRPKRVSSATTINLNDMKQPSIVITPLKLDEDITNDAESASENEKEEEEDDEDDEVDEESNQTVNETPKSTPENNKVAALKGRGRARGRGRSKRTIEVVKDGKTIQITLDGHDDDDSPTFSIWNRSGRGSARGKRGRGGRGSRGKRSTVNTPNRSRENSVFTTPHLNDSRKRGYQSSAPSLFEDDTLMSTGDCFQTPASRMLDFNNEDSQSSLLSSSAGNTVEGSSRKRGKMEVCEPEGRTEFTIDLLAEYEWPQSNNNDGGKSRDTYMIQEQIAEYLGVKSFKRKYPDLIRRPVDMEERNYIYENGLASEKMCDLGLTAVYASEILDIMCTDYPDKYEEYKRYQREKQYSMRSRLRAEPVDKSQLQKDKAIQSASNWNTHFNKERKENRRCCMDLQNLVVQKPKLTREKTSRPLIVSEHYPVALVPGQYAENYLKYTPEQLACYPINSVLVNYEKLEQYLSTHPNPYESSESEDSSGSDDEGSSTSDESVTDSASDSQSSDSENEDTDPLCKVCSQAQYSNKYKKPEKFIKCSSCKNQAHPTCIEMSHKMYTRCLEYEWKCAGCKTCSKCKQKRDNRMLFCDQCDRGYHLLCLGLRNTPEGRWHCEVCTICSSCGVKNPEGHPNPSLTALQKQELSMVACWSHEYTVNKLTNIREHLCTLCVPCAKRRKQLTDDASKA